MDTRVLYLSIYLSLSLSLSIYIYIYIYICIDSLFRRLIMSYLSSWQDVVCNSSRFWKAFLAMLISHLPTWLHRGGVPLDISFDRFWGSKGVLEVLWPPSGNQPAQDKLQRRPQEGLERLLRVTLASFWDPWGHSGSLGEAFGPTLGATCLILASPEQLLCKISQKLKI